MATLDTRPQTVDEHVAALLARVARLEQRRALAYDGDGRAVFPGGIDTDGSGDAGAPGGGTPDPVTALTLTPGAAFDSIYLDAEWALPVDLTPVLGLELRLSKVIDPGGAGEALEVADVWRVGLVTTARIRALEPNTTYELSVYTYSTTTTSTPATDRATTGVDTDPPGIPAGLAAFGGLRTIVATWDDVADVDVIDGAGIYELELWDDVAAAPGTMLRRVRVGGTLASIGDLDPDTTYHVRVRAVDSSGNAGGWTGYVDVTTGQAGTADIQAGAITADSAILAAASIVTANIADLAVTDAKIGSLTASKLTAGNITATVGITTGRLQVGAGPGATGVYIDDQGIRLYSGATVSVHLDANTGTATFVGTITATGGAITGDLDVSGTLTGGTYQTAATGNRLVMTTGATPLNFYTGHGHEVDRGYMYAFLQEVVIGRPQPVIGILTPRFGDEQSRAAIILAGGNNNASAGSSISLETGKVQMSDANLEVGGTLEIGGRIFGPSGSVGAPTYGFMAVANTGMFASAGLLRFSVSNGERVRIGTTALTTMAGVYLNVTNGGTSDAALVLDCQQSYRVLSDNTGPGSSGSRLWIDGPNGGTVYIGPRSGGNSLHRIILRTTAINLEHVGNLAIQLAETNHSIHSSTGGVWVRTGTARVYVYGGSTARVAALHPSSGYVDHYATDHVNASARALKDQIADAGFDPAAVIRQGRRIRRWRYANAEIVNRTDDGEEIPPDPVHGRERIGWVAEEAPPEIVARDADGNPEGIALGAAVAVVWAGMAEVLDRLDALEVARPGGPGR